MPRSEPRKRAVQQRAEDTKEAILDAAVELFSTQGYDGVSIRAIEEASGTKRGLASYHFGDKEALWREVVDRVFRGAPATEEILVAVRDLDKESQIRALLTAFVRFSAEHPELNRLIIQEGKANSWRLMHLVERYVKPRLELFQKLLGQPVDAHTLYSFLGSSTLVFDVEAECEQLFGFNPRSEAFIAEHARRVCDMAMASLTLAEQRET